MYNIPALLSVIGVGQSRNFQGDFGGISLLIDNPIDFDRRRAEHSVGTIVDLVREAVRDGYESLNEARMSEPLLTLNLIGTVNSVQRNRIQISLGSSDYVQEGDVFNIYLSRRRSGQFYSPFYYNGCYTHGTSLATARVVEIIDDYNSILEVENVKENADGDIQVGNIVALSDDIDLISRIPGYELHRNVLMIGRISTTFVKYHYQGRVMVRNITPYIIEILDNKAPEFNFRFIR